MTEVVKLKHTPLKGEYKEGNILLGMYTLHNNTGAIEKSEHTVLD